MVTHLCGDEKLLVLCILHRLFTSILKENALLSNRNVRNQVFSVLKGLIPEGVNPNNGRTGMDLWKILVLVADRHVVSMLTYFRVLKAECPANQIGGFKQLLF